MTSVTFASGLVGAARWNNLGRTIMDIILHLGAHRTATTSFQHYVRDNRATLMRHRIGFWGPQHARNLVFPGFFKNRKQEEGARIARDASQRIRMLLKNAQASGFQDLLISDENLLGTCAQNLRRAELYPAAGKRVGAMARLFGTSLRRIVLSIRSQDVWWTSACALSLPEGRQQQHIPDFDAIAQNTRSWREVIADIARAAPQAELVVLPFDSFAGDPAAMLKAATGYVGPLDGTVRWMNRATELPGLKITSPRPRGAHLPREFGQWQPFTPAQEAVLREAYLDDIHWLTMGAHGLARLEENRCHEDADAEPPVVPIKEGYG